MGNEFIPKAMNEEMQHRTNWGSILMAPDDAPIKNLGFELPADTDGTYLARQTINAGIKDSDEGRTMDHKKVRRRFM